MHQTGVPQHFQPEKKGKKKETTRPKVTVDVDVVAFTCILALIEPY
jgi:hypothetical protein